MVTTSAPPWGNDVEHQLGLLQQRVQQPHAFQRLWNIVFSEDDRIALGDDMYAFERSRSVGAFMQRYRWSQRRAVIEAGRALNLIDDASYRYFLREIGEAVREYDLSEQRAATLFDLVVVATSLRRAAYWRGAAIPIDWMAHSASWEYFLAVCKRSSQGSYADASDFDERVRSRSFFSQRKYRLVRLPGFPEDLKTAFSAAPGLHKLELEPSRICVLEEGTSGDLVRRENGETRPPP